MKRRSFQTALAAALALCMLAGGCGDGAETTDSDSKESSASTTTEPKSTANAAGDKNVKAKPMAALDFPRPDGAGESMYTPETSTLLFHMTGKVEDLVTFYTDKMGELGWDKDPSSEVVDGAAFLDFTKGNLAITVTLNPRESRVTVIAQGEGLHVPASLAQDEFDDIPDTSEEVEAEEVATPPAPGTP